MDNVSFSFLDLLKNFTTLNQIRNDFSNSFLEEEALLKNYEGEINTEFILSGIKKLTTDNFRKAKVGRKRGILREVVRSIFVHPDNALRIDFWAGEETHGKNSHGDSLGQTEGILPFLASSTPLAASFRKYPSKPDSLEKVREAVGCGMRVFIPLCNPAVVGSSGILSGGR